MPHKNKLDMLAMAMANPLESKRTALTTMASTPNDDNATKKKLGRILRLAAAREVAKGDPWAKHHLETIPAERVVRHLFDPATQTWFEDETIVKMEKEAFAHGAMRFCYRMKKRAPPPKKFDATSSHSWHDIDWGKAPNYVAKSYRVDGKIDTSEEAKNNVKNDIMLQYEASHWGRAFNERSPPKRIIFLKAYAIHFPDREGQPWFAVERFISGKDTYGAAFTKHNTNSGYGTLLICVDSAHGKSQSFFWGPLTFFIFDLPQSTTNCTDTLLRSFRPFHSMNQRENVLLRIFKVWEICIPILKFSAVITALEMEI